MPYFNYCGAVWGNINKGLADKLQKLQNRAARIFTFSNYDVRSSVLLDELGWERLEYVRLTVRLLQPRPPNKGPTKSSTNLSNKNRRG